MAEITNNNTTTDATEGTGRYHTRAGKFETCCICEGDIPIVYAPNGNPTGIGMYNPYPLMDADAYDGGMVCCDGCSHQVSRAYSALLLGDADALKSMAEDYSEENPVVSARLRGLADGIRHGRIAADVDRNLATMDADAEPTDTANLADVAVAVADAAETIKRAAALINHMADMAESDEEVREG